MAEDTSQQDFRDSDRVSGAQECEIGYFASKFGLSLAQIRELIANMDDRETLEREANALGTR